MDTQPVSEWHAEGTAPLRAPKFRVITRPMTSIGTSKTFLMSSKWINEYGVAIDAQLSSRKDQLRAALTHAGAKGQAAEGGLAAAIAQVLGPRFNTGTGEIVDCRDRRSGQTDIVLFDDSQPFVPESRLAPGVFLADSTLAAIEVKLALTTSILEQLFSSGGGLNRLKEVRRVFNAGDRIPNTITASEFMRFYDRVPSMVFAYESTVAPTTTLQRLNESPILKITGREQRYEYSISMLDALFVLGQGVYICNRPIRAGLPSLSFSFDSYAAITEGEWTFYPEQRDDGITASAVMRLSFFLACVVPRIERLFPVPAHYLGEPRDTPIAPRKIPVAEFLLGNDLADHGVHAH